MRWVLAQFGYERFVSIDPIATSTTIAQTYGFAPAFALPAAVPVTYQAIAKHPDIVTGVTPIGEIVRSREFPSFIIDEYA
jgi:hypothetical protein